jgi:hypothetical protein
MKCWFCKTDLGEPHYHDEPVPVLLRCTNCPTEVEYLFGLGSKVYRATFGCIYHGQTYVACIVPDNENIKFFIYRTEGNLWFPALKTKNIPNVTPSNIRNKVALYLVFS